MIDGEGPTLLPTCAEYSACKLGNLKIVNRSEANVIISCTLINGDICITQFREYLDTDDLEQVLSAQAATHSSFYLFGKFVANVEEKGRWAVKDQSGASDARMFAHLLEPFTSFIHYNFSTLLSYWSSYDVPGVQVPLATDATVCSMIPTAVHDRTPDAISLEEVAEWSITPNWECDYLQASTNSSVDLDGHTSYLRSGSWDGKAFYYSKNDPAFRDLDFWSQTPIRSDDRHFVVNHLPCFWVDYPIIKVTQPKFSTGKQGGFSPAIPLISRAVRADDGEITGGGR